MCKIGPGIQMKYITSQLYSVQYTGREAELLQELKRRIECRRSLKKQKGEQEFKGFNIANNDDLINSQHTGLDVISEKSLMIMDDQLSSEVNTSPLFGNVPLESIK
ncbi:hypothetical protein LSM04_002478 [Trypanosoma melophagium]|uniref:uncharacterized protein n=1 Tax=Trypanosoma melophagium TaxID=715481 RepID=UPI00351A2736|nr:hypothetical protein LSM04_002478 [Trypanosoma melophagium]